VEEDGDIIAEGFTYSEYARRGFTELIMVSVISFLVLFITEKYVIKHTEQIFIASVYIIVAEWRGMKMNSKLIYFFFFKFAI
jgi:hypothetical protein